MIKSILGGKSKNLFDISKADVVINANIFNPIPEKWECFYKMPVTSGQTYTVSCDTTANTGVGTEVQLSAQTGNKWNEGTRLFVFLTSEEMVKDWTHIKATFTIPDNATQITFSALSCKFFRNFQLELGSTATEYVPHELTSYKSIMKVSDVCQLLDKSKYPATITNGGITFTNNGDGSITLNGTNTGGGANLYTFMKVSVKAGHYYYIYSGQAGTWGTCMFTVDKSISATKVDGYIGFQGGSYDDCAAYLFIGEGATFSNYVIKPQLFDLTEMFGAGNEPKTVAEFRAKFPNNYYPYSPSCFVTSYDKRMSCKTKNLINSRQIYQISQHMNVTIWQGEVNYVCTFSYELSMLEPNTGMAALFEFAYSDGTYSYIVSRDKYRVLSQITDSKKLTKIRLINWSDIKGIISNIQLEKGTKVTDYVPYGYV